MKYNNRSIEALFDIINEVIMKYNNRSIEALSISLMR